MNAMPKPDDLIDEYIELRDLETEATKRFKEFCKTNYTTRMEEIEAQLLNQLNALGVDSVKGKSGTAFKKIATSVTIADQSLFRRHVIGLEGWDLIDWRANKTAINEIAEAGEPLPPGINRNAIYVVQVRKPT